MKKPNNIRMLSDMIKKKRSKEKISLRDAAAQCNVSFSTIARIERMEGVPDIDTISRIVRWLDIDMSDVVENYPSKAHLAHLRATKRMDSETANALKQLIDKVVEGESK